MDTLFPLIKVFASSLFLLSPSLVNGIALPETPNAQCGYGYDVCPQGYDCVKNSAYAYGPSSICQPHSTTPLYTLSSSTPVYSSSTPVYSSSTPVYSPSTPVYSPSTVYSPTTTVYGPSSPRYSPTTSSCTDKYGKDCTTAIYSPTTPIYTPTCTRGYGVDCSTSSYPSGGTYSNNTYNGGSGNGGSSGNGGGSGNGGNGNGQDSTFTPVVGCGKVALRREINDLQKNHPDIFNMLLLALESLQNVDETKDLSYYQLSGIHGYPWTPWQYPASSVVNPGLGYCEHRSPIFTTWHRPYLVLLEQVLYKEAKSIAAQFTGSDKAKYQAAAEEVRIPYWDWASPDFQSHIPASVQAISITVIKPGSGSITIPNPLFNYRFLKPQSSTSGLGATTIRGSDDSVLVSSFPSRQQQTLDLFIDTAYEEFSSDLEGIHDVIHLDVGGSMVFVSQAAFDPIFWLHHCNVDRLMAMYQAAHPGVVVTPGPRSPTQALGGPGPDDINTPLYPFRHPNAKEWTSNDVSTAESIFTYGYAYPEVQPSSGSSADLQTQATQKVNELYGPDINSHSFQGVDSGAPQTPTARLEWSANVQCDMSELSGPHRILIYVGPYDKSSPDNYADVSKLAGAAAIFSGSQMPVSSPNKLLNISIPLTESLIQESTPLHPQAVVPKLADQLHWVVQKVGEGSYDTIPTTDLPSLKVALISHLATYSPDSSQLPQKSDPETHPDATAGKEGGLQAGQAPPVGSTAPQVLNGTLPTNSTGGLMLRHR